MHNKEIIIAIYIMYFFIGGLSTTNILRLTSGNKLSIMDSKCVCDNCGYKIELLMQIPILSYIICRGKCRNCGCHIPFYSFFLEIVVFGGMSLITTILGFTYISVIFSFLFYEVIRLFTIIVRKRREHDFVRQYIIAVLSMFAPVVLFEIVIFLYHFV